MSFAVVMTSLIIENNDTKHMICPFCQTQVPRLHPNSHVIPEWMYKKAYDEKHRAISLDLDVLKKDIVQQGYRASIVCDKCENEFSKDDNYGCLLLSEDIEKRQVQRSLKKEEGKISNDVREYLVYRWLDFDFKKLQGFIFSVLIRNHLWHRSVQKEHLSDKDFQKIKSIYSDDGLLDDDSYPIQVIKLSDEGFRNVVMLPYVSRFAGDHRAYIFSGGGYLFHAMISSHRKPREFQACSIKKDATAVIIQMPFQETGIFKQTFPSMAAIRRGDKSLTQHQ